MLVLHSQDVLVSSIDINPLMIKKKKKRKMSFRAWVAEKFYSSLAIFSQFQVSCLVTKG